MVVDRLLRVLLVSTLGCGCAPQTGETGEPTATPGESATDPATELEALRREYEATQGNKARLAALEAELSGFLERHPDHPDALVLLAQAHLEQGEVDESLSVAKRCVAVDPRSADCWLTIAVISETRKQPAPAVEGYGRYLALTPEGHYADQARRALVRLGVEPPGGAPAPRGEGTNAGVEAFSGQEIKAILNRRMKDVQHCYNAALGTQPDLAGRMTITLALDREGVVTDVHFDEDTVGRTSMSACIRDTVAGWRFGLQPADDQVTFSLVFSGG